ncbi:perforin-1-like [Hoplias malabaricus]|uniref:perforin-1-like n=1 Tax=Hoplias malabaricus TaxID=27720 RepID=UPI003462CDB2
MMGQVRLVSIWTCCSLLFLVTSEEQMELDSPADCENTDFVPGHNLGGEGFDIVKMARKGSYVIDMEKWDIGNGKCKMYKNPYLNVKQKIPVAMESWRTISKCSMKVSSKIYESSEALVNGSTSSITNNWRIGLNLPCILGISFGGTHSSETLYVTAKSKEDRFSFTKHISECSFYSYKITTLPPVHSEFLRALQALPKEYKLQAYQEIIDTFGTHYTTGVKLGGRLMAITAIRTCKAAINGLTDASIKACLDLEASINHRIAKADVHYCRDLQKKMGTSERFNVIFSERHSEITGGNFDGEDLIFTEHSKQKSLKEWVKSLKTIPDVVTYSLRPLHVLLNDKHSAKEGLKMAIEKYIRENALKQLCMEPCTMGSRTSVRDQCVCICEKSPNILTNCCPAEKGLSRLKVFKLRAKGLYGDRISQTDAYVQIEYDDKAMRSSMISNDDNPVWNESFDFGSVKITMGRRLTFKIYDEENIWNDELLGECSFELRSGTVDDMCTFKYGSFYFSYSAECAPNLQGSKCSDYSPSSMNNSLAQVFHSRNGILTKDMWKLQRGKSNISQVYC